MYYIILFVLYIVLYDLYSFGSFQTGRQKGRERLTIFVTAAGINYYRKPNLTSVRKLIAVYEQFRMTEKTEIKISKPRAKIKFQNIILLINQY